MRSRGSFEPVLGVGALGLLDVCMLERLHVVLQKV